MPRPDNLLDLPDIQDPAHTTNPLEHAAALVQQELLSLIQHEAAVYPVKEKKKGKKRKGDGSVHESSAGPVGPLGKWEDIPVRLFFEICLCECTSACISPVHIRVKGSFLVKKSV